MKEELQIMYQDFEKNWNNSALDTMDKLKENFEKKNYSMVIFYASSLINEMTQALKAKLSQERYK